MTRRDTLSLPCWAEYIQPYLASTICNTIHDNTIQYSSYILGRYNTQRNTQQNVIIIGDQWILLHFHSISVETRPVNQVRLPSKCNVFGKTCARQVFVKVLEKISRLSLTRFQQLLIKQSLVTSLLYLLQQWEEIKIDIWTLRTSGSEPTSIALDIGAQPLVLSKSNKYHCHLFSFLFKTT